MGTAQIPHGGITARTHDVKHGLIVLVDIKGAPFPQPAITERVGGQARLSHGKVHCGQLSFRCGVAGATLALAQPGKWKR
eukprot:14464061-Alexandrium_andersonii.AAC.1